MADKDITAGVDLTPFAEAPWLLGVPSPYYKESHRTWQKTCRSFIDEHLGQHGLRWVEDGVVSPDVYSKFAEAGMLIPCLPAPLPIKLLQQIGINELPGGLQLTDYDYFHFLIYTAEVRLLQLKRRRYSN